MFSPFLGKPFAQAIRDGVLPAHLNTIAGTWGALHDTGELTYMNLVHLAGCDGTDPDSMTHFEIEGRRQAMLAIEALRRYTPGCAGARLQEFRHDDRYPRHAQDRRRLQYDRGGRAP